jgi:hypothetical protein
VSLSTDSVFQDDKAAHQLATVYWNPKDGYEATLTIAV